MFVLVLSFNEMETMRNVLRTFVLFILAALPLTLGAQQLLEYNLKVGDTFLVKQSGTQEMVMEIEGTQQIISNDIEALFLFKVALIDGKSYGIDFEFKDFAITSSSNLQGQLMDIRATEPKEGDMMSTIFNGLLGTQLQLQLQKNGKILAVNGADKLIENMLSTVGELDEFTKSLMKKSLEKEFSSESLANSFEQMTYIYDQKAVSIGTKWNTSFKGKINAENQWTLEKIEEGTVSISGTAKIIMDTEDTSLSMKLNGQQETMVEASSSNGFPLKMIVKGSGEGISTMAQAQNVEIPTTLKQTITYELITE